MGIYLKTKEHLFFLSKQKKTFLFTDYKYYHKSENHFFQSDLTLCSFCCAVLETGEKGEKQVMLLHTGLF